MDPVRLEIFRNLYEAIAEEMGAALGRSAFSPNIKERRDYSCAIFDGAGGMVAQAAHIPVHLGSQPEAVRQVLNVLALDEGDIAFVNDPFLGGTHLPDITAVAPVFVPGEAKPAFYVANRAHHADVGGMAPGSMPVATEIFQEGFRIPPVKLVERGEMNRTALTLFLANVRTPREREGDLTAQIAALRTGIRRLQELVKQQGLSEAGSGAAALQEYAERRTRAAILELPAGRYRAEDFLDDDGCSPRPVKIAVSVEIRDGGATVDFSGSDPEVAGPVNSVHALACSAAYYVFRCLVEGDIPMNAGAMRPIRVIAPEGTVVNARFPAATAAGNVETSQRMVDVLFRALAQAAPERIPAASSGTMSNVLIGATDPRTGRYTSYYETIAGGMGARPGLAGLSAVHTHMTNTFNTPVEALELAYPFRVRRYAIAGGTGGQGAASGGDGVIRELEFLAPAQVTVICDRQKSGPYGLQGGEPGTPGKTTLTHAGNETVLPGKITITAQPGDRLCLQTPGGGGHGVMK